jgi:hypothetical protein
LRVLVVRDGKRVWVYGCEEGHGSHGGAYPNDPNRSILSLNKRPKGEIPLESHCGMNAGCKVSREDETFGRRFWCCQNIDQAKKELAALVVSDTVK